MKKIQQTVHEKIKSIVSAIWEFCASISDMTIDSGIQLKGTCCFNVDLWNWDHEWTTSSTVVHLGVDVTRSLLSL